MERLLPHLRDDLRDLHAPTLLIQARGDRTIPANSLDEFYARIGARTKEKLWLDHSGHLVLEDYSKEIAFARILQFIEKYSRAAESAAR
jgi:carboxylesterase